MYPAVPDECASGGAATDRTVGTQANVGHTAMRWNDDQPTRPTTLGSGSVRFHGVRLNSNRKLSRSTLHDLPSGATVRPPVQQVNQTKRYGKVH